MYEYMMIMLVWVLFFGAVLADDCVDKDDGISDSDNRGCIFYDVRPDQCGDFDTSEFIAAEVCCSCDGQGRERHTPPTRQTRPTPPREETSTVLDPFYQCLLVDVLDSFCQCLLVVNNAWSFAAAPQQPALVTLSSGWSVLRGHDCIRSLASMLHIGGCSDFSS